MDRRLHERTPVAFQVHVTSSAHPDVSVTGEAIDISKSGIGVNLPVQFALGTLIRIEIADSTLCGFVMHARKWPLPNDSSFARNKIWIESEEIGFGSLGDTVVYRTGIEVVEATIGTSGLSQLLRTVLQDAMPYLEMAHA